MPAEGVLNNPPRLLDLVEALCHDPLITVNASPAAVYRSITADPPTLLVDEADTIFGPKAGEANEALRGLLNAGHQRNRPAKRYDAAHDRVHSIPTFAMATLAGIGAMPDTIEDRAVVIRMRRRAPGETVAPYRHRRDRPPLRALATALADWLRTQLADREAAEPAMPVEDRAADTWEPLVAVADHAAGAWPARARHAALTLTRQAEQSGHVSVRVRLLADLPEAFAALGDPLAAPTTELLATLNADPEAPWAGFGPHGLTGNRLGDLLREFDIRSDTLHFGTSARPRATATPTSSTCGPVTAPPGRRPAPRTGWAGYPYHPRFPSSAPVRMGGLVRIHPYQHHPRPRPAAPTRLILVWIDPY